MFSRNKDMTTEKQSASAPVPAKRSMARMAPSIISADLEVQGNLIASGDIQIDGTVHGDVRSGSLTVGEKATINGEVVADDLVVRGRIVGSIRGRRVQLCSTCHVEGDILHEALAVETGAFFEGNCRHSDDPLAQNTPASSQSAARPEPAPAPQPAPAASQKSAMSNGANGSGKTPGIGDSPVVVKDGGVVVKRPAAQ